MPIRCVNTLKDLENDEKEDLFMVLKKVHEVVKNVNGTSYVTCGIQTGAAAGQTVKVRKHKVSICFSRRKICNNGQC
jgi:Diadenosine tetraphosphate (Ap4A) hydrolase and other HIT family hydrolases